MAEKATTMVLKADLQCYRCCKKVKKLLCKYSDMIGNQVYDEKQNIVTFTVICCNPEKFLKKISSKGGKTIESIQIKVPKRVTFVLDHIAEKPKPHASKELVLKAPEVAPKPGSKPEAPELEPKADSMTPVVAPRFSELHPVKLQPGKRELGYSQSPALAVVVEASSMQCQQGYSVDPCYYGLGTPLLPPQFHGYGRPPQVGLCGCGGCGDCCGGRSDYFIQESPSSCNVM